MKQKLPEIKPLRVKMDKLALDPNNPRFITQSSQRVDVSNILDAPVQSATRRKMASLVKGEIDNRISDIEQSILENGFLPVDRIYVIHLENGRYLTIEGNRRVTAIQNLLERENLSEEIRSQIEEIEVSEILGNYNSKETQDGILYLLGVRHHGSLKPWTPFAQARNVFETYCRLSGQSESDFEWNDDIQKKVASTLSISNKEVYSRALVYRAMRQISQFPPIAESDGLKDRDYSLISDALLKRNPEEFASYFHYETKNFALPQETIERFDKLCRFSEGRPSDAPVNKPSEWGPLAKILSEPNEEERSKGLHQIEIEKQRPSEVYARIAGRKHPLQWEGWLMKTQALLTSVTFGDKITVSAFGSLKKLSNLLGELEKHDVTNTNENEL